MVIRENKVVADAEEVLRRHGEENEDYKKEYSETYDYLKKSRTKEGREAYDALQRGDINSVRDAIDTIIERNSDALDNKPSPRAKATIEKRLETLKKISEELGNSPGEEKIINNATQETAKRLRGAQQAHDTGAPSVAETSEAVDEGTEMEEVKNVQNEVENAYPAETLGSGQFTEETESPKEETWSGDLRGGSRTQERLKRIEEDEKVQKETKEYLEAKKSYPTAYEYFKFLNDRGYEGAVEILAGLDKGDTGPAETLMNSEIEIFSKGIKEVEEKGKSRDLEVLNQYLEIVKRVKEELVADKAKESSDLENEPMEERNFNVERFGKEVAEAWEDHQETQKWTEAYEYFAKGEEPEKKLAEAQVEKAYSKEGGKEPALEEFVLANLEQKLRERENNWASEINLKHADSTKELSPREFNQELLGKFCNALGYEIEQKGLLKGEVRLKYKDNYNGKERGEEHKDKYVSGPDGKPVRFKPAENVFLHYNPDRTNKLMDFLRDKLRANDIGPALVKEWREKYPDKAEQRRREKEDSKNMEEFVNSEFKSKMESINKGIEDFSEKRRRDKLKAREKFTKDDKEFAINDAYLDELKFRKEIHAGAVSWHERIVDDKGEYILNEKKKRPMRFRNLKAANEFLRKRVEEKIKKDLQDEWEAKREKGGETET